eukprot:Nk52_evm27s2449 gene=Nk52_evmTU27s2449
MSSRIIRKIASRGFGSSCVSRARVPPQGCVLFTGQGSQFPGMGLELSDNFKCARLVFEEMDETLKLNLSQMMFEKGAESEKNLKNTIYQQPAILSYSIALLRILQEHAGLFEVGGSSSALGGEEEGKLVGLGHSLGEFSFAVASNAIRFSDAVQLVHLRGLAMTAAASEALSPPAMAAFMPLDPNNAQLLCEEVQARAKSLRNPESYVCDLANVNSSAQVVLSGTKDGIKLAEEAGKSGACGFKVRRITPLNVSCPFHSSLMGPVKELLSYAIIDGQVENPRLDKCPSSNVTLRGIPSSVMSSFKPFRLNGSDPLYQGMVSNYNANLLNTPDQIRNGLLNQTDSPVLFETCVNGIALGYAFSEENPAPVNFNANANKHIQMVNKKKDNPPDPDRDINGPYGGVKYVVELGPSPVLSSLIRKSHPLIKSFPLCTLENLQDFLRQGPLKEDSYDLKA